jgi:hypothetical protein
MENQSRNDSGVKQVIHRPAGKPKETHIMKRRPYMNLSKLTHAWNGRCWFLCLAVCLALLGPAVRPARAQVYEPGSLVLGRPMGDWLNDRLAWSLALGEAFGPGVSQPGPVMYLIHNRSNPGISTINVPAGVPLSLNMGGFMTHHHGDNRASNREYAKSNVRPLEFSLDDFSLSAAELALHWVEVSRYFPLNGDPEAWSSGCRLFIEPLSPGEHGLSYASMILGSRASVDLILNVFEVLAETLEPGQSYTQSFDILGPDGAASTALPKGWSVTDETTFNIYQLETQRAFPLSSATRGIYPYAMNAGRPGEEDRTLAIYVPGDSESQGLNSGISQIQFLADVNGPVDAMQFQFDIEAWDASASIRNRPTNRRGVVPVGEAAFDVMVDLDAGNGFEPFLYFDIVSTGELQKPEGEFINGNEAANRVHFNSGILLEAIPADAQLRFRWAAALDGNSDGLVFGIDNFSVSTLGGVYLPQAFPEDTK